MFTVTWALATVFTVYLLINRDEIGTYPIPEAVVAS